RLPHDAGERGGVVAVAPEDVAAHRPDDGTAGVLSDEQSLQRPGAAGRAGRQRGVEPDRRAEGYEARVDGQRALRGELYALAALRTVTAQSPEEHVREVAPHHRRRLLR